MSTRFTSDIKVNGDVEITGLSAGGLIKSTAGLLTIATPSTDYSIPSDFPSGTTLQYYRGDKTWQTLNTAIKSYGDTQWALLTRTISASGNGLTGGGDLSADRTISLDFTYLDSRYDVLGSGVTSFNSRTGAVMPGSSDYITTQVAEGSNLYWTNDRGDARITFQKGAALGITPLDAGAKIDVIYLPDAILGQVKYQGTYNATTDTPALGAASAANKGYYYVVSTAGGVYSEGDWAISNGVDWQKVDNSDAVSTVFGRMGNVLAIEADYSDFYPLLSGTYNNPSWINQLAWSKITGAPDFVTLTSLSATSPIFYNTTTGVISSQAASAVNEGYVTTGTQTFGGVKTFGSIITTNISSVISSGVSAIDITSSETAYAISLTQTGSGYGIHISNTLNGHGIVVNGTTPSSGLLFVGQNNGANTFTVNKFGTVTAPTFVGALTGNASTVTTNANLTGAITSVGNATSIGSQTGTGSTFAMSASPTFTGIPAAPTAAPGTNTTQIASTAFVTTGIATAGAAFLPLTGGIMTGPIYMTGTAPAIIFKTPSNNEGGIVWYNSSGDNHWSLSTDTQTGGLQGELSITNKVSSKVAINIATNNNITLTGSISSTPQGTLYGTAIGSITSAQLATSLTNATGTGSAVFNSTPLLLRPTIYSQFGEDAYLKIHRGYNNNEAFLNLDDIWHLKMGKSGFINSDFSIKNIYYGANAIEIPMITNVVSFTQIPTAPTATAGTNTTQLATTAFVTTAFATSPTFITPILGVAAYTTLTGGIITAASTSAGTASAPLNAINANNATNTEARVNLSAISTGAFSARLATIKTNTNGTSGTTGNTDFVLSTFSSAGAGGLTERLRIDYLGMNLTNTPIFGSAATFSGNIGLGGAASNSTQLINGSISSANTAFELSNTSASGYGGYIRAASGGTQYILRLVDYAGTSRFSFYGDGTATFGGALTGTNATFNNSLTVEGNGSTFLNNYGSGVNLNVISSHATQPLGAEINYSGATPNGIANHFLRCFDTSADRIQLRSNGGIANYSANNVNLSDEKSKKELIPMESQWDVFKNIDFIKYKYKDQTHEDWNYGVGARALYKVAPHFVNTDGWGEEKYWAVYDGDIHYAAHKALQETMTRTEQLEFEIKGLKERIVQLENC